MKKHWFALGMLVCMMGCNKTTPVYDSVDDYPVKEGSLDEMVYSAEKTSFSVWSPAAKEVTLRLFEQGIGGKEYAQLALERHKDGTWRGEVKGDLAGQFYTFQIDSLEQTPGIFAKAVGVNGQRGAIIDMQTTNPEGWSEDVRPAFKDRKDAIIYETHYRDFSIHPSSGVSAAHKGKFLALSEEWSIAHLKELGITHVQILPSYDYGSIDETALQNNVYNWGYDPLNYNAPEGGYSTDPFEPTVRIREMKQMIQALHSAGIRVVMDVVYNHTFDVAHSNFHNTCPNYFYRYNQDGSLGNASGCGNETASERAMMRKYIVESCRYWVEEYHIDGFRFDLMGIHDIETMRAVRAMLDEIDPTLLLHGEGWAAAAPLYPNEKLAMKANMREVEGVGAFCDDMRDALRGPFSDDHKGAFLAGELGHEESIKFGIVGCIDHPELDMQKVNYSKEAWCKEPTQCISYVSCHDDMMLTDRLMASVDLRKGELEALDKLAQTIVLTSQGIPFLWTGEEVMRNKKGVHNSYCSPDSINAIDWTLKAQNIDLFRYYQGLIALRKSHPAFRMGKADLVRANLHFLDVPAGVVAFVLDGAAVGDDWQKIVVVCNAQRNAVRVNLPEGQFNYACKNGKCPYEGIEMVQQSTLVGPQEAQILYIQ